MWIVDYYRSCQQRKAMPYDAVLSLIRIFSERGIGDFLISSIYPEYSEDEEDMLYTVNLYCGYEFKRFHSEDAAMIAYMLARTHYYSVCIREVETEHDEETDSIRCAACRDR